MVTSVLEPVLAPDALLVSEANRCYPPVAAALDISPERGSTPLPASRSGALCIQTVNSRHSQIKARAEAERAAYEAKVAARTGRKGRAKGKRPKPPEETPRGDEGVDIVTSDTLN